MADQTISIADAVSEIRNQIKEAQANAGQDNLKFSIREVILEIQGVLQKSTEAGGDGKVKFSVMGFGAEAAAGASHTITSTSVHKVLLKLEVSDSQKHASKSVEIGAEHDGQF